MSMSFKNDDPAKALKSAMAFAVVLLGTEPESEDDRCCTIRYLPTRNHFCFVVTSEKYSLNHLDNIYNCRLDDSGTVIEMSLDNTQVFWELFPDGTDIPSSLVIPVEFVDKMMLGLLDYDKIAS